MASCSPDGLWIALMAYRDDAGRNGQGARSICEIRLADPTTGRVRFAVSAKEEMWGDYRWTFSPDGRTLAVTYRTGDNIFRPEQPDPMERPMAVDVWELPAP